MFTGSAEVGRALGRHSRRGVARPAITEMGGKNPAIVAASADIEAAAAGIASSAYGFSGQKCSACSRAIVVGDAAHDALVAALHARAAELGSATPATATRSRVPSSTPARSRATRGRSPRRAATARSSPAAPRSLPGHFVAPAVVAGVPAGHLLTREELFVPFVTVTKVDSFDAALAEANAVDYGLTAGVFSCDRRELDRFLDEIEAGVVYVNRRAGATTGAWPGFQSFCGWKAAARPARAGSARITCSSSCASRAAPS